MQSSTLRGDGRCYRSRVKAALPRTSGPGFLGIRVSFAAGAHSRAQSARNSEQLRSTETAWECGNRPQLTPYTLIAHPAGGGRSLVRIQSPRFALTGQLAGRTIAPRRSLRHGQSQPHLAAIASIELKTWRYDSRKDSTPSLSSLLVRTANLTSVLASSWRSCSAGPESAPREAPTSP